MIILPPDAWDGFTLPERLLTRAALACMGRRWWRVLPFLGFHRQDEVFDAVDEREATLWMRIAGDTAVAIEITGGGPGETRFTLAKGSVELQPIEDA
jgi:hypothetical protein